MYLPPRAEQALSSHGITHLTALFPGAPTSGVETHSLCRPARVQVIRWPHTSLASHRPESGAPRCPSLTPERW